MLGLIGANAELDGALSTTKKLVDFDEVGVNVLLLYVPVPKFGKVLFDVAVGMPTSVADLPTLVTGLTKVKVVAELVAKDTNFLKDSVLVTAGAIDTIFVCSVVPIVLVIKVVSFVSRVFVADTFDCADDVIFGKAASDFVTIFVLGLDEEKPLGTMAAVDSGVVLMFVVVVEELRVTQLVEGGNDDVTLLMSSA